MKKTQKKDGWCKKLNIPLYKIAYNESIEPILEGIAKDLNMEEAQEVIDESFN